MRMMNIDYIRLTDSLAAGYLLTHLHYLSTQFAKEEFFKTDKQLADELAIKLRTIRTARARLVELKLIEATVKGMPPICHYRLINLSESSHDLSESSNQQTYSHQTKKPNSLSVLQTSKAPLTPHFTEEQEEVKKKERKRKEKGKKKERSNLKYYLEAVEVLSYLNLKSNHNYEEIDTNLNFIVARFTERSGLTVEDCRLVIEHKCSEWLSSDKMKIYLRPATLFNKEKFSQYLPAAKKWGGSITVDGANVSNKYAADAERANRSLQLLGIKLP